eukprot:2999912-Rhodomonas_salina.1
MQFIARAARQYQAVHSPYSTWSVGFLVFEFGLSLNSSYLDRLGHSLGEDLLRLVCLVQRKHLRCAEIKAAQNANEP